MQDARAVERARLLYPDVLKLSDGGKTIYGCDQAWFSRYWQKLAGCGPTVGTMMLWYLAQSPPHRLSLPYPIGSKEQALHAMKDVFSYIRPGIKGVNTTEKFLQGMRAYCAQYKISCTYHAMNIPAEKPYSLTEAATAFIQTALLKDCPVAFLNLDRGNVPTLESWHWIMLQEIERAPDGTWCCEAVDQSARIQFSLSQWLHTTRMGGGLAYIVPDHE